MKYVPSLLGIGVSRIAGLHESATATGRTGSRAQAAIAFARLEHERVRLEDKLDAQVVIQAQLEARVQRVHEQLALLRTKLDAISGEEGALPARAVRAPRVVREAANDGLPHAKDELEESSDFQETYQIMSLEY